MIRFWLQIMEAFYQVSLEFIFLFINVYITLFIFDHTPTHATIGSKPTSNSVPIEHVFEASFRNLNMNGYEPRYEYAA